MIFYERCPKGHVYRKGRYPACPFCELEEAQRQEEAQQDDAADEIVGKAKAAPPAPVYAAPRFPGMKQERLVRCVYAAPPFPKGLIRPLRRTPPIESVYNGPDFPREPEAEAESGNDGKSGGEDRI